ncbi:hypothetical protein AAHA92_21569 [Salvia divinorum]|uniref:Uncharacterized protein n=1 Tax=Salvia divinorum TaxID=28513 RepID=A0ABD1GNX5_SALDI
MKEELRMMSQRVQLVSWRRRLSITSRNLELKSRFLWRSFLLLTNFYKVMFNDAFDRNHRCWRKMQSLKLKVLYDICSIYG